MKVLIDAGHGGLCFGHYMTRGKRSPGKKTAGDEGIFEGEFNRQVAKYLRCVSSGSMMERYLVINPGPIDICLKDRVKFVNDFCKKEKDTILISIHANASPAKGWSRANGSVVFHSTRASSKSKLLAKCVRTGLDQLPLKSGGIKKAPHYITTKTSCPAILIECGFMTNRKNAAFLSTGKGQRLIYWYIAEGIENYHEKIKDL